MTKIENIVIENEFLHQNYDLLLSMVVISINVELKILIVLTYRTIDDTTTKSLVAHAGLSLKEKFSRGNIYKKQVFTERETQIQV